MNGQTYEWHHCLHVFSLRKSFFKREMCFTEKLRKFSNQILDVRRLFNLILNYRDNKKT